MAEIVLVVGAGASSEVGLPVGSELKQRIAKAVDIRYERGINRVSGDASIERAYRHLSTDTSVLVHAGRRISSAMPQAISIDNFLDAHNDDKDIEAVGKLAIAKAILDAERSSKLYFDRSKRDEPDFQAIAPTWFIGFWKLISENCRFQDFKKRLEDVALVVFNYDRCVEQYLYFAIQNYYAVDEIAAASALQALKIYHPYGSLGIVGRTTHGVGVPYGGTLEGQDLIACSRRLRTFTEGTDEGSSEIVDIRLQLGGASKIVFLGFAFHRLNVNLLFPASTGKPKVRDLLIVGTAKGMSSNDCEVIEDLLKARTGAQKIALAKEVDCSSLFDQYFRSLSMVK